MAAPRERLGGTRMMFVGGPFDGRFIDARRNGKPCPYKVKFNQREGELTIEYRYHRARPIVGGFLYEYSSWTVAE